MSGVFGAHRWYLSDERRVSALQSAIERVVTPGDVVVDVGTGTGVLALMACAAGAARVYAIDCHPLIEVARKIGAVNGYGDRIHYIREDFSAAVIPEPVDVVVSDLIGPFAFESGIFDILSDARARYLKPHGRTIPSQIALYIAPVECRELRDVVQFWSSRPAGFDMRPAYEYARKTAHHLMVTEDALLSSPVNAGAYAFTVAGVPTIRVQSTTRAVRDGVIDALAGWFDATLAPGVQITNAPGASDRLARRNLVLPVTDPLQVAAGDEISLDLHVLCHDQICRWTIECRDGARRLRRFSGSTFEGLLMSREDLAERRSRACR